MFQVLIVTHGRLADELVTAAATIAGSAPNIASLCLDWEDSFERAREKVEQCLDELRGAADSNGTSGEVLILTDMYGGTPFNVVREFAQPGRVEVVCGVNLPMVLRLSCVHQATEGEKSLSEAARWIHEKGRMSIRLMRLEAEKPEGDRG